MSSAEAMVEVLLATYNGERFLRAQIDSVLAQTYSSLRILARDDGSTDATPLILAEYAIAQPERFRIISGPPMGSPQANFARLLEASDADYVAFCDQDDVWLAEKIATAMSAMRSLEAKHAPGTPLLVFNDLLVVNADLEPLHKSFWKYQRIKPRSIHFLNRIIMTNTATGNSELLNRPLADLAQALPARVYMHDWWVAVLANAFGDAIPLASQLVLYRQHGANVLGIAPGRRPVRLWPYQHQSRHLAAWESAANMARALLDTYGDKLTPGQRRIALHFITIDESRSATARLLNALALRLWHFTSLKSTLAMLWLIADLPSARKFLGKAEPISEVGSA